jgi:hypothetical protein
MSALLFVVFAAGYCFRWVTQHLLYRIAVRGQRVRPLPKIKNPSPPPARKTDATTRMSEVLSAAITIDWSEYANSTAIFSLDGGQTWRIRDKSGKFATVTIEGLPKVAKKDAND